MICRLCGRERGTPDSHTRYAGPDVCMWTESAECESVRAAYKRGHDDALNDALDTIRRRGTDTAEADLIFLLERGDT